MKAKYTVLNGLLIIVLIMGLVACAGAAPATAPEAAAPAEAEAPAEEMAEPMEEVTINFMADSRSEFVTMQELLPQDVSILATHPIFGPDSAADSLKGRKIALCKESANVWEAVDLNRSECSCVCQFDFADML